MAKSKTTVAEFEKTITDTGKKKDLALEGFLEDNATFKENDAILLSIPVSKQAVRLVVTKVAAEQNNLAGKLDIAYYFNDGSMLFQTSLEKDGYEWQHQVEMEAEPVTGEVEAPAPTV